MSETPIAAGAAPDTAPARQRWVALITLLTANFMNLMDVTIVNVALPTMKGQLGADDAAIEWVVAAYILSFALLLLPFGRLGDTIGRKWMFLGGVAGFTLASLACGQAESMTALIVARAVQGATAAMMTPQTLAIAQVIFPPHERAGAFSLFGLTASLASVAGPLIGGTLIGANLFGLTWEPIFLVNVPIGIAAIIFGLRFIPNLPGERDLGIDIVGILLAAATVLLIVFPLVEGRGYGWPVWLIGLLVASPFAALAFLYWERHQRRENAPQLLPMSLLGNPAFLRGAGTLMIFFSGMAGFFMIFALFLQSGFGFTPLQSGLTTVPFPAGVMLASFLSGRIGRRWLKARAIIGGVVQIAGFTSLYLVVSTIVDSVNHWAVLPSLLVSGFGMGFGIAALFQMALAGVPNRDAGSASGALQALNQIGGALGVAIVGALFFGRLSGGMGAPDHATFVDALQRGLIFEICVYGAVTVLAFTLHSPKIAGPAPEQTREGAAARSGAGGV